MRVKVHDHQGKANDLTAALKKAGAEIVTKDPEILLTDFDTAIPYYKKMVEKAYQGGAEIALYSHGAPVITAYDGIWEPSDKVGVYLAQSPGQKAVMEAYGYPHPISVIGWHFCKIKTFKPTEIDRVLFAPWHPHSNGYLYPMAWRLNDDVMRRLVELDYRLTVYHVGDLRYNGVREYPGVDYLPSDLSIGSAIKQIDKADIIVTYPGTFASLAVARGKPVVVYGQDIRPHDGYNDGMIRYVANWEAYKELMRYPYDISDTQINATGYLLEYASKNEAEKWRNSFIGNPLDTGKLTRALEHLLGGNKDD